MDKQQILEFAKKDPKFSQAVLTLEDQIGDMPITSEGLDELVQMLEFALNNPDKYQDIIKAAIDDDLLDQGDLPDQFDPIAIISVLVLMYGMQERAKQKGFARGGLASIAAKGRHGDTMLAHINPREAAMLKRMGGSGTINPSTGLPEFFSWKKLLAVALPIAVNFFAPGLGSAIGASLGFSGAAASALGGALIGGTTSALTGGNFLQGATLGGLGGGLGGMAGSAANNALGLGLGTTGQAMLGSGLVGGALGAATGKGFVEGALQGAAGSALGSTFGGMGGDAMRAGGTQFGNMLTAGYDPKQALVGGALSGLAAGMAQPSSSSNMGLKPSTAVVDGLRSPAGFTSTEFNPSYSLAGGQATLPAGYGVGDAGTGTGPGITAAASTPAATSASSSGGFGLNAGTALKGLALASMLGGAPPPVKQAVSSLSPSQQEYFNRPSITWDWGRMQKDADSSGLSLSQYMARNWNEVSSGAYNQPTEPRKLARGGALSQIAYAVGGPGSGRDDTIDAKLSDGEYVIDAETVAMLGDGSGKAGAARLDQMRAAIRSHKGKNLAKGRISPNAKSPLAYMKGLR